MQFANAQDLHKTELLTALVTYDIAYDADDMTGMKIISQQTSRTQSPTPHFRICS